VDPIGIGGKSVVSGAIGGGDVEYNAVHDNMRFHAVAIQSGTNVSDWPEKLLKTESSPDKI